MDKNLLKQILSSFDKNSFTQFVWEFWSSENKSNPEEYIQIENLRKLGIDAFEQVMIKYNGIEKEKQGYNLILPFYEPLELFFKKDNLKLSDSKYFRILKKYQKIVQERESNWSFHKDGDYQLPIVAFVSNISGFEENFYQEHILPKLDYIVQKIKIDAWTKIGTCDSFIELDFDTTLQTFKIR